MVATLCRNTEAKYNKDGNPKKVAEELKRSHVKNGAERGQPWYCARFVCACTQMCWNLHQQRSWNATA